MPHYRYSLVDQYLKVIGLEFGRHRPDRAVNRYNALRCGSEADYINRYHYYIVDLSITTI